MPANRAQEPTRAIGAQVTAVATGAEQKAAPGRRR
jgi:hypothetical protein